MDWIILNSKKKIFSLLIAMGLLAILAGGLWWWSEPRIGQEVDGYKGVPVYYNGILYQRAHGRHVAADGYYYGQKWQCVEYVKRFFKDAKGHEMPDVWGHAKDFFNDKLPDGVMNQARGLWQYRNGGRTAPVADDLLVFTSGKFGHVAIVTEVGDDYVEIIQQNIWQRTRRRMPLQRRAGRHYLEARGVAGWLRLPEAAQARSAPAAIVGAH